MRPVRRLAASLAVVAVVTLVPATAFAHPLGNFTVNRYAGIVLAPEEVRIEYVVDMAEIPTVQALPRIDVDGDGTASSAERAAWAGATAAELLGGLELSIDGTPVNLDVRSASVRLTQGQGGLDVLRLSARFAGEAPASGRIAFADANFEGRVGWREITIAGAAGTLIVDPSVPTESVTDGLRAYPDDLLASTLDIREATAAFEPGEGTRRRTVLDAAGAPAGSDAEGVFVALVGRTGPFMLLAMLLAFAFGAFHALGPGHGKTLMAAYLVGSGGRTRQAVAVGAAVAVMHTASVLALGFVVLTATEVFAPERVYPWLGIGSGLVAFALGAWMLVARLGAWSEGPPDLQRPPHMEGHPHDHGPAGGRPLSRRSLAALATAGGILPSPTALVVLLASVAAHRVGYGLALIASFSLGLAGALVAVGLLSIRARDAISGRTAGRLTRLIPIASAAAITVVGIVLVGGGAAQL